MTRAKLPLILLALAVVLLAVSSVTANCIPAKTFTNFNTIETPGAYYYIFWGDPTVTSEDIDGRFWQTDNFGAGSTGTYDDSLWLLESGYYPNQDMWYLNGNLGAAGVLGCPSTQLTVTATNSKTGTFFSATIDETPPRSVSFDFSRLLTDFQTVEIPRPQIISSTRVGTDVNLTINIADATAGSYGGQGSEISDVVIYRATSPTTDHIADGGWVEIGRLGAAFGQTDVVIDCSSPDQATIGSGLQIAGEDPTHVGANQSLVECDANLADPGNGKIQLIDKPGKPGNKPIKRR